MVALHETWCVKDFPFLKYNLIYLSPLGQFCSILTALLTVWSCIELTGQKTFPLFSLYWLLPEQEKEEKSQSKNSHEELLPEKEAEKSQEETLNEQTPKENCLPVCIEIRNSSNPMHKCRYCSTAVSQICFCNIEDPESDNPQHRVHKSKQLCQENLFCDKCGKKAKNIAALNCHKDTVH